MFSKLYQIFLVLTVGILIACLFSVPVRSINYIYGRKISFLKHRRKFRNILAVFTWYGFLLVFFALLIGLFYYNLIQYFSEVSWDQFIDMFTNVVNKATDTFPILKTNRFKIDTSVMIELLFKLPGIIGKLIISVLISIYLLLDWNSYVTSFRNWKRNCLSKKTNRFITDLLVQSKDILFSYLKGQSLDALIMGSFLSIGLKLLKVPLGIPIGILAGIGNLVPYAGPVIAFSFTIIVCIIEQRRRTLIAALIYLIVLQQLDSSFIGPKVLGKQMRIRPLFIIISILIGGTLFGIAGMIFAVPAAAIIKSIIKKIFTA